MSELRPSDIYYSQDSISNRFSCRVRHIGDTLDELLSGSVGVNCIPTIDVVNKNDKYYSVDNRRLLVFKEAEKLGFLETIDVNITPSYYLEKFTSTNGGISVRIRGDPGGYIWRAWKPSKVQSDLNKNSLHVPGKKRRREETDTDRNSAGHNRVLLTLTGSSGKSERKKMKENHSQKLENKVSRTVSLSSQYYKRSYFDVRTNKRLVRENSPGPGTKDMTIKELLN